MVTHTYTHDNYYNPRCAHAHQGLIIIMQKAGECENDAGFLKVIAVHVVSQTVIIPTL